MSFISQHTAAEIERAISSVIADTGGDNAATAQTSLTNTWTIPLWTGNAGFVTVANLTSHVASGVTASDIGLGNVENTALSTWAGSTNLTTLGTITTGTWNGDAIDSAYIGGHTHTASDVTSGAFADARISESSVTQHESALSIASSQISDKASANGVASLDGTGKIPSSQLPAIALSEVFVVASQSAQLALTAQEGDVVVRTDESKSYIHNGGTAGTMADYTELQTPADAVTSVNGYTGTVSLTTSDVSEGTNLYYTSGRFDTAFSGKDTDDLTEGATNQYFTNGRARSSISLTTTNTSELSYDSSTGVFSYVSPTTVTGANSVTLEVRNTTGSEISKGAAVYISGHSGSKILIDLADSDASGKYPAIGLASGAIPNNSDGEVTVYGELAGVNTSSYSVGDVLYLSSTAGALTNTRPTSNADAVQNIGKVARSDSNGIIIVSGSGRANDIPNLTNTHVFIGGASGNEQRALAAGDILSGTFADARISQSSVTQHQAALSITESQISDFGSYQPLDSGLTSIAGLPTIADKMLYTTASDTYATTTLTSFARSILDDADAATVRTTIGVDAAGTDNSTDVTFAGAYDYLTLSGQQITLGQIDLSTDVTGTLPSANIGSHTHVASDITDFQESVEDDVANLLAAGSGVSLSYNDVAGVLTISATGASVSSLNDINDVTITSATTGDLLRWSGSAWVNYADSNYAAASHTHTASNITDFSEAVDDRVDALLTAGTDISLTYNDVANTLTIAYTGASGGSTALTGLTDVTITSATTGDLLRYNGTIWVNYADSNYAAASHTHAASDITSGTFADARIAQSNVTQHQAALSITESQISDLGTYQTQDAGLTSIAGLTTAADKMLYTTASDTYAVTDLTSFARSILDDADAATVRTTIGVDAAGTDNSTDVTLATVAGNYLSITGQEITAGTVPISLGGTGATTAAGARTALDVDQAGTDNSTNVTLAGTYDYLTLSGQQITLGQIDLATDVTGVLPSGNIGSHTHTASDVTDFSTAADARIGLAVLDDLADVVETTITTGDLLRWNGTNWVNYADSNYAAAGHNHTLDSLSNVTITSIASGEIVKWNGSAWVNNTLTEAGILGLAGGTLTGEVNFADSLLTRPLVKDYAMEVNALGSITSTATINLENGNVHTATVTGAVTLTFSNPIASGDATSFVLELTNGGSSTVTFPAAVDWEGGTAPTLTAAGVDILVFYTRDGGTTWHGIVSSLDSK